MSIHAHEILNMMVGHSYTEEELVNAIKEKFGEDALFHTCSQKDLDPVQMVAFLKKKGKFAEVEGNKLTVDPERVCGHDGHHHHHHHDEHDGHSCCKHNKE